MTADGARPSIGKVYDIIVSPREHRTLGEQRQQMARGVDGVILDIGGGTGVMLPYFDDVNEVHIVDPNPHFRARASEKANDSDVDVIIEDGRAENIPYGSEHFDHVIASQVLCSVADQARAIEELHRVLKADGDFRYLEHVHSPGGWGIVESLMTPAWKHVADGCHLNRDTTAAIANGPFEILDQIQLAVGILPPKTYVRGRAQPVTTDK
ncbi:MAG: class I SAM-dependent methyltransferase [Halobacteriaceae archaeon]